MIRGIAFDFDGVLIESVEVKTRAFAHLFSGEPPEAVQRIVEYHRRNGGISRIKKFKVIYRDILKRPLTDSQFQTLCGQFAKLVVDEVVAAPWVEGAEEFLTAYMGQYLFFVISGTPDKELKDIIRRRNMERFFVEVLGSPTTKEILLQHAMTRHGLRPDELVFVGDAETDWNAADRTGVPFIWRQTSPDSPTPAGFSGQCIPTLAHLDACLSVSENTALG